MLQLRAPLLEPLPGTLPEPEIHRRLVHALGALDAAELAPLRAAEERGSAAYAAAFFGAAARSPKLGALAPVVLYETLGPTLPEGAAAAAPLLGLAIQAAQEYPESLRRAGFGGANALEQGQALFDAILRQRSGVVFSIDEPSATWERLAYDDRRVHLAIPELLDELPGLAREAEATADPAFPFVLAAGERRTSTANTIFRDPSWRKKDAAGALRMNPADAAQRLLHRSDQRIEPHEARRGGQRTHEQREAPCAEPACVASAVAFTGSARAAPASPPSPNKSAFQTATPPLRSFARTPSQ